MLLSTSADLLDAIITLKGRVPIVVKNVQEAPNNEVS